MCLAILRVFRASNLKPKTFLFLGKMKYLFVKMSLSQLAFMFLARNGKASASHQLRWIEKCSTACYLVDNTMVLIGSLSLLPSPSSAPHMC